MVKLIDVAPSGYATPLLDAAQRIEIKGAGPQQVVIEFGNTSIVFAAGHRVRVDVTSSSFPKFEPNPNKAHNVIYSDAKHRSMVELQVSAQ